MRTMPRDQVAIQMTQRERESMVIRCMACRELFSELEDYWDHKDTAEHPDKGEYWINGETV